MGQRSPTCTSPSMPEWPRIVGCQQQPFPGDGHAMVCLSDFRRLAPTWKTARRSPLPRSSSANSAGSRHHLTTLITNDWDGWADRRFWGGDEDLRERVAFLTPVWSAEGATPSPTI